MSAPTSQPTAPTLPAPHIPRLTRTNVTNYKRTVLYKGVSGTGKTLNAFSWPKPIAAAYFDPNLATVSGLISAGAEIDLLDIRSWSQFADQFVPAVVNRQFAARTIVIDSIDFLSELMWSDIQGTRGKLTIQDFGTGKTRMGNALRSLIGATKPAVDLRNGAPIIGKPAYNLICTVHLKNETNDDGNLVKVNPALMGAFKDELESYFNTVFLCEVVTTGEVVNEDGRSVTRQRANWLVNSVPPDRYHTCKDSIGGNGGLAKLPAKLSGTYPALCAAWGCEPEPDGRL